MRRYAFVDLIIPALDRFDIETVLHLLDENCSIQIGSRGIINGKTRIKETLSAFFSQLNTIEHQIYEVFEADATVVIRGNITFTHKDEWEQRGAICDIFKIEKGKIVAFQMYMDCSGISI